MATVGKYPGLAKHVQLGDLLAKNRVFMASLTRNRSVPTTIPNEVNVRYYQERAKGGGAGLIFTEGILTTPQGTEWPNAPGIWDEEHAQGWKEVVDAVHGEGTPIVAQLWHVGRVAHPDMEEQKNAGVPVYGPSAVAARGGKFRQLEGQPGYITPTAVPDPTVFLEQFTRAAKMAKIAGFDGVELHSANGYLVEQFLSDVSNVRDDDWGGSIENRCRLGLESVKRLIEVYGANRVGIKLSPCGGYNDQYFTSTRSLLDTFKKYIAELDNLGLAYIQITQYNAYGDSKHGGEPQGYDHEVVSTYGDLVKQSKLIVNCGYDGEKGEKAVNGGKVEAVVFGQAFISNPDYFRRLEEQLPLSDADFATFYAFPNGQPGKGYTDYPLAQETG